MNTLEAAASASWEVPTFRKHEFGPRNTKCCVCIPVINEGMKLIAQLDRMATLNLQADVIIGDGGSTDGSNDPSLLQHHGVRTLLIKTGPGKLSAQLRMLFAYAIYQGYTGIVMIDGNGKDGVEAIPQFLAALDAGFDFVQGSRYLPGGSEENTPLDRRLASKWIHAPLLSLAAGFRYTDTTNGFRAVSSRFLLDSRVQPFRNIFDTYNLHYYLSVMAPRLGFRVTELPVRRVYPPTGPTPSKINGLAGKAAILKLLLLTVAGRYKPR
jgi:dolichol-phosphate mannosyltransferase